MGGLGIVKTGSDRTNGEAKAKLKEGLLDYQDGLAIAPSGHWPPTTPVIDRRYTLSEVPKALRYLQERRAQRKAK